jgi:cytochrome c peroxidase
MSIDLGILRASALAFVVAWAAPAGAQGLPGQAMLGRQLFFDTTLSTPPGQACSSCHDPATGFRIPDSRVNLNYGVAVGALPRRVTNRSAPTIAYAAFLPEGPPSAHFQVRSNRKSMDELLFIGGLFWDGRARNLEEQATFPFQNPNEMNDLVHNVGSPELVVEKVRNSPYTDLFRRVYGANVFDQPTHAVFGDIVAAIGAYERSPEVSPFTSKFDAYRRRQTRLTQDELDGMRLMTGTWNGLTVGLPYTKNAQCIVCHGIEDHLADGNSMWTFSCYTNIGVPKNPDNPFYAQTDSVTNPVGYNPYGDDYVDFGLGEIIYPINGLPRGNRGPGSNGHGDFLAINGGFKVPTLRNVDKRPHPGFVKAYMHNGVFKSLKEVVHFYNTRNLTTVPGEVIDFTQDDPYAHLQGQPLWPRPEVISPQALLNPTGIPGQDGGELGNLGLTDLEEDHIVAFLKTLTDGFVPEGH